MIHVTVRAPRQLRDDFKQVALANGSTPSREVRKLMKLYVRMSGANGNGNGATESEDDE